MKAIVIAAGSCRRLRSLIDDIPKCMLSINGKPIIQNTIELFRKNGISDISVIRGYKKEKINFPDITYFENNNFWNNNILHSLMFARQKLEESIEEEEDVVITYSDIMFEDNVLKCLLNSKKDIVSIVDTEWMDYYEGRTDHPVQEAEKVIIDNNGIMLKIGKNILTDDIPKNKQGEFIGLWKFTPKGIKLFLKHFDRLNSILKITDPYQSVKEWQKSYMTDIFQEMIDKGEKLHCVLIQKNWVELDTVQDFKMLVGKISESFRVEKNIFKNKGG